MGPGNERAELCIDHQTHGDEDFAGKGEVNVMWLWTF